MSLKTDNFKLYKYEDNDIGDLRFINDSMDLIDKGINPFYVATLDSANTYKVTTGLNKTSLANGYSIKVAIPSNSTGAVSITVDSVTVPVKKPNGNAVTNFKQNGVYSLTYYNSVFILASGGGADTVNFTSDKLLTGYSANDSNGEKVNGTMPNNGAKTASLNCGGSYTIPKGYHNGSGKVTANSLSSQTSANATAKDIIKGKTAWVNGSKLTGTATIQSSGGMQIKSDKITITKSTSSANLPITINNIGFKPKIVIMNFTNETGSDPTSGGVQCFAVAYDKNSSIVNILDISGCYDLLDSAYGYACTGMGGSTSNNKQSQITSATFGNGSFSTTIYGFAKSWSGSVECSYIALG